MNKKPSNPKHGLGIRKVPIHTVPMSVMSEVGLAMMEGGMKYGTHNYRQEGVLASTYVNAVWRHLMQQWWDQGEDIDIESGLNHVTKAIASLVVLRDSMMYGNFVDDRPIQQKNHIPDLNAAASKLVDKYPEPVPGFTHERKMKERLGIHLVKAVGPIKAGDAVYSAEEKVDSPPTDSEIDRVLDHIFGGDVKPKDIPMRDGYRELCDECGMQEYCMSKDNDLHCSDCVHDNLFGITCRKGKFKLQQNPRVGTCLFFERKTDGENQQD